MGRVPTRKEFETVAAELSAKLIYTFFGEFCKFIKSSYNIHYYFLNYFLNK